MTQSLASDLAGEVIARISMVVYDGCNALIGLDLKGQGWGYTFPTLRHIYRCYLAQTTPNLDFTWSRLIGCLSARSMVDHV